MHTLTLSVGGMRCRRCVREATALIRDVVGVHTVIADQRSGSVRVVGTMTTAAVLASLVTTDFDTTVVHDSHTGSREHDCPIGTPVAADDDNKES